MRLRRILAAAVVTSLAAPAALLTSSPAAAATATRIVGGSDGKGWLYASSYRSQPGVPAYGDTLSLSINVVTDAGQQVYDGTLTVQRKVPGSDWKTIGSESSAYLYKSIKAVGNASYRVLYSGTADYAPATAGVTSKVQRKLDLQGISGKRAGVKGKVSPKLKGKVVILKKQGKKWKRFKAVRTNKKSRFVVYLPAPRKGKYFWRIQIASSKAFATTNSRTYYTRKY
ncbi:hypothetical protein GCM10027062_01350 [Nocardioides hungaricus]